MLVPSAVKTNPIPIATSFLRHVLAACHRWCLGRGLTPISILMLAIASLVATWPIMTASNSLFPQTIDAMGHLTKVKYLSDCLKEGHWPLWFPYWYNGSTVLQYYPPLSFVLLIPVQLAFDNIMVTFKFLYFMSQFVGAAGTWALCRSRTGYIPSIMAGFLYASSPILLRTTVFWGAIAQWPIIALTPWLLLCSIRLLERHTPRSWVAVCVISSLLVLSQPMHAYMIYLVIGILTFMLFLLRLVPFGRLVSLACALGVGVGLTSIWSIPGVTHLEHPTVPYLLPEASFVYSAWLHWFHPSSLTSGEFYVGLSIVAFSTATPIIVHDKEQRKLAFALWITSLLGVYISFGQKLPLYGLIPFAQSLVPYRILTIVSLLWAVQAALGFGSLTRNATGKANARGQILACGLFIVMLLDINPFKTPITISSMDGIQSYTNQIQKPRSPFDLGRFGWVCAFNSEIAYFPFLQGLNMTDGWNIEGTPHCRSIWLHNIALSRGASDYVTRNLLRWNAQFVLINSRFEDLRTSLTMHGFDLISDHSSITFLRSSSESSYFMKADTDSLAIGVASPHVVMHFPWFVQGQSDYLEDYSDSMLSSYRLIYLAEPRVRSVHRFEQIVRNLVAHGKIVYIEWGRADALPIFGTLPVWYSAIEGTSLEPTSRLSSLSGVPLPPDPSGRVVLFDNLDEVLWNFVSKGQSTPAIGYMNIDAGRLCFVGLALSQMLTTDGGLAAKPVLEAVLDLASPNKSFVPAPFDVLNSHWRHDGFSFEYEVDEQTPIIVSITHSPRWKATIDGTSLPIGQTENLIRLDLPAGRHSVNFTYGVTWVTWMGLALSLFFASIVMAVHRYLKKDSEASVCLDPQFRVVKGKMSTWPQPNS